MKPEEVDNAGGTSIVLFSGGLDSLAGALYELNSTNRHVVLVSHRNLSTMGLRQRLLAERLARDFPKRVTHVWVDNNLANKMESEDETQRTRTFFFTAMAAVAAHIDKSDRIRLYENGVMSINLPFVTQLVGSRASRSTHSRALQLMDRLVNLVAQHPIEIDNPFIWRTKTEIVRELAQRPQAELIRGTCSCSRSQYAMRTYQPHCGTCIQCLHRWISTMSGGAAEFDEASGYETDFLEGPRQDGRDRVMALGNISFALDCSSISDHDFIGRFADPLAWVNQAFPNGEREDVAKKVASLFRRHGEAVKALLVEAISQHATGVLGRALPSSSLLALVLKDRLDVLGPALTSPPVEVPFPEPKPDTTPDSDKISIAVDEERQAIRISDRSELFGPTIFRLMKFLIEVSLAERAKPGLPINYRSVRARTMTDRLGLASDEAVRAAVNRARDTLEDEARALGFRSDPNDVIERTNYGYRLNPNIQVLKLEEFLRHYGRVT